MEIAIIAAVLSIRWALPDLAISGHQLGDAHPLAVIKSCRPEKSTQRLQT